MAAKKKDTKEESKTNSQQTVKSGDKVKVQYTGTLNDGKVFDSSEGKSPLQFQVGSGQVIPGFDKAVNGLKLNEEKTFTIPSAEAYGEPKKEMVHVIDRKQLPEKPEPKVGMVLVMQSPDHHQIPARIAKVEADKVTLDMNHPLAGQDLTFKVKVVGINEEDEPEACGDCSDCSGCGH